MINLVEDKSDQDSNQLDTKLYSPSSSAKTQNTLSDSLNRSGRRSRVQRLTDRDDVPDEELKVERNNSKGSYTEKVIFKSKGVKSKPLKSTSITKTTMSSSMTKTTISSSRTVTKSTKAKTFRVSGSKKESFSKTIPTSQVIIEEKKEIKYVPSGRKPVIVDMNKSLSSSITKKSSVSSLSGSIKKSTVNIKDIHYLGLKPISEDHEDILNQLIAESVHKINEKYPCDSLEEMCNLVSEGELENAGWTAPDPLHITSSLINGKASTKNKKSLEEFKIGIEENINVNFIIIAEGLFITALVKPKLIDVNAKIPYMALRYNNCKPKDCTNIIEFLLYTRKPTMSHGEEKLRTYYAISEKSKLKDDVFGEIKLNYDVYKNIKVWFINIKQGVKVDFESFIKKLSG